MIEGKSWINITKELVTQIYIKDGIQGFYRGYLASLAAYVPNSAMWWAFYHFYQGAIYIFSYLLNQGRARLVLNLNFLNFLSFADEIIKISPIWISHLFVQCIAATLGGFTTTIITNPLDIIRARLQVTNKQTNKRADNFTYI